VRARVLYGLPVFSVMVYLTDEGHPGAGSNRFEEEEILGQRQHVFVFHEVRLWELDARRFLEAGPEGLLPLVPLMRAEQEEEPLRQAIARATEVSDNRQRADLLAAIVIFGSLRHPEQVISNLIRREEMKESSIVQSFIEEGRAEGREEGIQRGREEGVQRGREEGVQKGALIGEIRACQRFLRQRPSPQSMLLKKSPDELRRLADALEREVNERQK
jgi:predicted transposase YdaD